MAQIVVENLREETVEALKKRAERNHRSLQSEVTVILERATFDAEGFLAKTRALREEIAREFPNQTDSVELLREDRER